MNLKQTVFFLVLVSIAVGFLANSVLMRLFGYIDSSVWFPLGTLSVNLILLRTTINRLKKKLRL